MSHIGHGDDDGWTYDPRDDPESWDYKPGWRHEHDYDGLYKKTDVEIKKDKECLLWIYDRLVYLYHENENFDYMIQFKKMIDNIS